MKTFPLPSLKQKLAALGAVLFEGKGFFILRGLDPQGFSVEENSIISLGVSSYIHEERASQNSTGEMISTCTPTLSISRLLILVRAYHRCGLDWSSPKVAAVGVFQLCTSTIIPSLRC